MQNEYPIGIQRTKKAKNNGKGGEVSGMCLNTVAIKSIAQPPCAPSNLI
jgi:hypothetical protein